MKVLSVLRCFFVLFVCLLWVPSPLEERENCVEDQSTRIKKDPREWSMRFAVIW